MHKQSKLIQKSAFFSLSLLIMVGTRLVGFDDLGNTDNFTTAALELKLKHAGVIKRKEDPVVQVKKSIFQSNDTDSELEDD